MKKIVILFVIFLISGVASAGELTVYTRDPEGIIVSDVTVTIDTEISGVPFTETQESGQSGVAVFSNLETGIYSIMASKLGYTIWRETVDLEGTEEVTAVLEYVGSGGGVELTVFITDYETGKAISGATVKLGNLVSTTNELGSAVFTEVELGSYSLEVSADNYKTFGPEIVDIESGGTISLELKPGLITPGFELIVLIIAIGLIMVFMRRKRYE